MNAELYLAAMRESLRDADTHQQVQGVEIGIIHCIWQDYDLDDNAKDMLVKEFTRLKKDIWGIEEFH